MEELRKEMIIDIQSMNRHMTDDYLNKLTVEELINYVHPLYRAKFNERLRIIKNI